MPVKKDNKYLKDADAFEADFVGVSTAGFFEGFSASLDGFGDNSMHVKIDARGKIADRDEDHLHGVRPFLDMSALLATIKLMIENSSMAVKTHSCRVEKSTWPKYDRTGNRVVGSLGVQFQFNFVLTLKKPRASKRKRLPQT